MYLVLAYYAFTPLNNPPLEVANHKRFLKSLDARGRIYLSENGINGQTSISEKDAPVYFEWLKNHPSFKSMPIKIHRWHEHTFEKLKIKYRKQLVAIDCEVDLANTADHLSPKEWHSMLTNSDQHVLVDVRNDYEWKVGHFEGAELPPCDTFREFKSYADDLKGRVDCESTPVMMYCTGGIRCEIYSALLKEQGFKKVYQLDGGVINYGLQAGSKKWKGKLFVFDDRMTVPISEEETVVIAKCELCGTKIDDYYNCANMDCNKLFVACKECIQEHQGCCCTTCEEAPRVRPVSHQQPHKPFRKSYRYQAAMSSSEKSSE